MPKASTITESGSILILQWGQTGNLGAGSSLGVTFPTAFPNNMFNVQVTQHYGSSTGGYGLTVGGESVTGFTVLSQGGGPFGPVYWFAIGN